jgi:pSer/pThr/pTyr-binding forkhead associated (FHA) protein
MVQIHVRSGRRAGTVFQPSRFPCTIGRAADCGLQLNDPGVWDHHVELSIRHDAGVLIRLLPPAIATVNGESFDQRALRNGDLVEAGSIQFRFELSVAAQKGLLLREVITWLAIATVFLFQFAILLWLLR